MDLENLKDINRMFTAINHNKTLVAELPTLKQSYAQTVNDLYEIATGDTLAGEKLSRKAIELAAAISATHKAQQEIDALQSELAGKYGFQFSEPHVAVIMLKIGA